MKVELEMVEVLMIVEIIVLKAGHMVEKLLLPSTKMNTTCGMDGKLTKIR